MKTVWALVAVVGLGWFTLDTARAVVQDYSRLVVWLDHTSPTKAAIFWGLTVVLPIALIWWTLSAERRSEAPRRKVRSDRYGIGGVYTIRPQR